MYCSNCGAQVSDHAKFCSNCGTAINTVSVNTVNTPSIASSGSGDYRLILVDKDKCSASIAEDLLIDLLGYSAEDADQLVDMAPIEIADNLSVLQARTLAQAFNEYGCQMSVVDENGDYTNVSDKAISSVYDKDGNLVEKAAMVIGALTVINRVTSYRRYRKPTLMDALFRPHYHVEPPKPRRHHPGMMERKPMMDPFFMPEVRPASRMQMIQPSRGRGGHSHGRGSFGMGKRGTGRR